MLALMRMFGYLFLSLGYILFKTYQYAGSFLLYFFIMVYFMDKDSNNYNYKEFNEVIIMILITLPAFLTLIYPPLKRFYNSFK